MSTVIFMRIALTPYPRRSKRTLLKFELSIPESDFEMILQFEYSYVYEVYADL